MQRSVGAFKRALSASAIAWFSDSFPCGLGTEVLPKLEPARGVSRATWTTGTWRYRIPGHPRAVPYTAGRVGPATSPGRKDAGSA